MAAKQQRTPVINETQRQTAEARLRGQDLSRRERERLEMIKAAALGYDLPTIAQWTGRSVVTI